MQGFHLCLQHIQRKAFRYNNVVMLLSFSFCHRWNTEKQLCQYSLPDKVYFLVNFQNSHTRVVYWGNTGKHPPSKAGSILAFPVLGQLYWEYIFQYWPSSRLWRGSIQNLPQGGLLMSPLNFPSSRSYKTWPRISSSAMGHKGIVYLEYSGATFATHQAGKALGLSASSAVNRQDQARPSVRMHSVRAIVLPKLYCTLHIKFIGHIYIYIYKLRMSVLWLESGYTVKYSLSHREIPRDFPQAQAIFHSISLLFTIQIEEKLV